MFLEHTVPDMLCKTQQDRILNTVKVEKEQDLVKRDLVGHEREAFNPILFGKSVDRVRFSRRYSL